LAIAAWQQLIAEFRTYLVGERNYSPRTAREYDRDIRLWYQFIEEHLKTESRQSLLEFLAYTNWKPARRNRFLASLRAYYRWLRRIKGLGISDPTLDIDGARLPQTLPRILTPEEVGRLAEAARQVFEDEGVYYELMVRFLYGTGLRISELLNLKIADILFKGREPVAIRVLGKGGKERVVPLSPAAKKALVRWLYIRGRSPGYLWTRTLAKRRDLRGTVPSVRTVERALKRIAREADIDPDRVHPHVLRHAYASALAERGADPLLLAELLGHKSPRTTALYVHMSGKRLAEAVSVLPEPEPNRKEE